MDALVIGGGIIGMLTARELALADWQVTLLERQKLGQESSWAGGGILSPLNPWQADPAINALCRWSQLEYPLLAARLAASTGIDPEWTLSGLLFKDCGDIPLATDWCLSQSVTHNTLSPDDVHQLEPGLADAVGHSLLLPDIAQIRNPRLLQSLRADLAQRDGVTLREDSPVTAIQSRDGRIDAVECGAQSFSADSYVVASGAWSRQLGHFGGVELPVAPVKGQMLIFQSPPGLLQQIVLDHGRYLIPRRDGKILAGSTLEHTGFEKSETTAAREELLAFAYRTLPALRNWPVERQWAGLRPGTPDGIPCIGSSPQLSNLYFNCGHFRNGFAMAPASARLLADLMVGRTPIVAPEDYQYPWRQ